MKTTVYFCTCGGNISRKIDPDSLERQVAARHAGARFQAVEFLCSEQGLAFLERDLQEQGVERVVVAACSPREHESTFRRALVKVGLNPYLLQMVNLREQVAWVTNDPREAAAKAVRLVDAALRRVALHDPLQTREIEICPDTLVIGAGPAGLQAALCLAAAGRNVTLVEKSPVIGGLPVRYEELFPNLECGPCMLEPLLAEVLHGENAEKIELLTLAEVTAVVGSYGNFTVKIRQRPRHVDPRVCIGCSECIGPCPVSVPNEFDCGLGERKAVSLPFVGALPNVPAIDAGRCLRLNGVDCNACRQACPVEGAFLFEETEKLIERTVGAIVLAVGGNLLDCRDLPNLGFGTVPDVYTAAAFERLLASNGPTAGEIRTAAGTPPAAVAIVHCVGSLDKNHREYCSGICCQYAFKYNQMIGKKLPGARRYHYFKEIAAAGKEGFVLARQAQDDPDTVFIRYQESADLSVRSDGARKIILRKGTVPPEEQVGRRGGAEGRSPSADRREHDGGPQRQDPAAHTGTEISVDMVILCPAVVPAADTGALGAVLDVGRDRFGFFEERHSRTDAVQSTIKGIYLAGACQSPMDIQGAMNQGLAAAGHVLSGLVPGRKLEINPVTAVVDQRRCSGCKVCIGVCPYKAIGFDEVAARVNDVLCLGCGTCAAACPTGAIQANHFTTAEILVEIAGLLS